MLPKKRWKRRSPNSNGSANELEAKPQASAEAVYACGLRLLARRAYPSAEMKKKLLEATEDASLVSAVLQRLVSDGYLNDRGFIEHFIQARQERKHFGRSRVEAELRRKGLDVHMIEEALEQLYPRSEEVGQLCLALEKKLRSFSLPMDAKKAARLYNYLLRQGFSAETVYREIRRRFRDFDQTE